MASLHSQDCVDGGSGVGGGVHRSASPRVSSASTSRSAQQLARGVNSLINSHKNALAQHNNTNHNNNSSIPQFSHHANGIKQTANGSARREVDKSATADSHISQLKMVRT